MYKSSSLIVTSKHNEGFNGPFIGLNTIKSVLDSDMLSDDTAVTLTRKITHSLGDENYKFTYGTGSITVKIDHSNWFGAQISP